MILCRGIAFGGRLPGKILHAIRPLFLRTNTLLGERFDPIAEKCAAVLFDRSFDCTLVVINKEPAQIDKTAAVLDLEKFQRGDERMRGATADVALIFDRRTL